MRVYWLLMAVLGLGLAGCSDITRAQQKSDEDAAGIDDKRVEKEHTASAAEDDEEMAAEDDDRDDETEEVVALDQLPAEVKATLLKTSQGGKLDEIYHSDEGYFTSAEINGNYYDIAIEVDGMLINKTLDEDRCTLAKVPGAVKATVLRETAGETLLAIYRGTEETEDGKAGKTVYTAYSQANEEDYEITVAEDGTLISKELPGDEDEYMDDEDMNGEDMNGADADHGEEGCGGGCGGGCQGGCQGGGGGGCGGGCKGM